jgi:hypothetical protein
VLMIGQTALRAAHPRLALVLPSLALLVATWFASPIVITRIVLCIAFRLVHRSTSRDCAEDGSEPNDLQLDRPCAQSMTTAPAPSGTEAVVLDALQAVKATDAPISASKLRTSTPRWRRPNNLIGAIIPPLLGLLFFSGYHVALGYVAPWLEYVVRRPGLALIYRWTCRGLFACLAHTFLTVYMLPRGHSRPPREPPREIVERSVVHECADMEGSVLRCWHDGCNGSWLPARARHCKDCGADCQGGSYLILSVCAQVTALLLSTTAVHGAQRTWQVVSPSVSHRSAGSDRHASPPARRKSLFSSSCSPPSSSSASAAVPSSLSFGVTFEPC